jgi:hypothetical protein
MIFPSLGQFLRFFHIFLCAGPCILVMALGFVLTSIYDHRTHRLRTTVAEQLPSVVFLVIGVIGSYFSGMTIRSYNLVKFPLEDVAELRIVRMVHEEVGPIGSAVSITDSHTIQKGLGLLITAAKRPRNREVFSDGYRIQIRLRQENTFPDRYLSVYQRSSGGGSAIVIVHQDPDGQPSLGEYQSDTFVQWVTAYVAPQFTVRLS